MWASLRQFEKRFSSVGSLQYTVKSAYYDTVYKDVPDKMIPKCTDIELLYLFIHTKICN